MSNNLQLKRGLQSALPIGLSGELLFTTDTKRLYLSDGSANNLLQGSDSIFTTGSIPFSNSSGKLTTDSSNFYWDNTNKRLGLGTILPKAPIQVHRPYTGTATTRVGLYLSDNNIALSGSSNFLLFGRYEDLDTFGGLTSGIRNIYLGNNGYEQGLAFNTASGGVGAYNSPASSEVMRLTNLKNVLINTTTDNGGKLQIKAPGALSTDIALRVRNSADTGDLMTVNGLGDTTLNTLTVLGVGTGLGILFGANGSSGRITIDGSYSRWKSPAQIDMINVANNFVGINSAYVIASAVLAVDSTTKGFLPPRMTTTQKNAIATPATGLVVYDTTLLSLYQYNGTAWTAVGGGGGGSTPVKLTSQTLTAASWTLVGIYYTYSFSNVNVTTSCDVAVTPQNASYLTAYNAQVLPFVGVSAGVATLYSQFPPAADMVVDIVITQTV